MSKTPISKSTAAKGKAGDAARTGPALSESYNEAQYPGGETHQIAEGGVAVLTTSHGAPVADDQNTLRQGARGPALLEDVHFPTKSSISTTSGYPSASSTPAATAPTAISS